MTLLRRKDLLRRKANLLKFVTKEDATSPALQKLIDAVIEYVYYVYEGRVRLLLALSAYDEDYNRIEDRAMIFGDCKLLKTVELAELKRHLKTKENELNHNGLIDEFWHFGTPEARAKLKQYHEGKED